MADGNGETLNKYVGSIITIIILICGLAVNWGMMSARTDHLATRVEKCEESQFKLQLEVANVQINQARDNSTLTSIKTTMEEIKDEIRDFRRELMDASKSPRRR